MSSTPATGRPTRKLLLALVLAVVLPSGWAALDAALTYGWDPASVPPPRHWGASTATGDCQVVAFGGGIPDGSGTPSSETLLYDPLYDRWRVVPASSRGPSFVYHAGLSWDPTQSVAVLFGGVYGTTQAAAWAFDPNRLTWTQLTRSCRTCPPERRLHSQTWSSRLGGTLVFGGTDSHRDVLDDMWMLKAAVSRRGSVSWSWTRLEPAGDIGGGFPAARFGHGMIELVSGPHAGKILIYGGWDAYNNALSDTWLYDPQADAFDEIATNAPTPRVGFGIGHVGNVVVIQGGHTNPYNRPQAFTNETWAFDATGLNWYRVQTSTSPENGRSFHDLASNPCDGSVILFDQRSDNSWIIDEPTWILRAR